MTEEPPSPSPEHPVVSPHIAENIEKMVLVMARSEGSIGRHQRFVERLTAALGRPRTLYLTLFLVAGWTGENLMAIRWNERPWDPPPFPWLQGVVSLAALLMTTMVLTTQNRQGRHADRRAQLDLQVNLLAEQKTAKLIALLEELRHDLPTVPNRTDPVADAMKESLDPTAVIDELERSLESPSGSPGITGEDKEG